MRLANDLRLSGVRVDQRGDVGWLRVPVVDELALGDELADPAADQVDAEHPARLAAGPEGASAMTFAWPCVCRMTLLPLPPSG